MVVRGLSNQLDLGTLAQEIGWCGEVLAHWVHALGLFCAPFDVADNLSCGVRS